MHKLEKLLNEGHVELVLKLTEECKDFEEVLFRSRALRMMGKLNEVPELYSFYQDLLDQNIEICLPVHIDVFLQLGQYDEARKILEHYSNLPYQSQKVEEMLRAFPSYINREESQSKARTGSMGEDEIAEFLLSNDTYSVMAGLQMVRERKASNFIEEFKKILTNPKIMPTARGMALAVLEQEAINADFNFLDWDNKSMVVNPSKLENPFQDSVFTETLDKIESSNDITFMDIARQVLLTYCLAAHPHRMNDNPDIVFAVVKVVALEALSQSEDVNKVAEEYHLNLEELNKEIDKVKSYLS